MSIMLAQRPGLRVTESCRLTCAVASSALTGDYLPIASSSNHGRGVSLRTLHSLECSVWGIEG